MQNEAHCAFIAFKIHKQGPRFLPTSQDMRLGALKDVATLPIVSVDSDINVRAADHDNESTTLQYVGGDPNRDLYFNRLHYSKPDDFGFRFVHIPSSELTAKS